MDDQRTDREGGGELRYVTWPALCFGRPNCAITFPHGADSFAFRVASEQTICRLLLLSELFLVDSTAARFDLHSPKYAKHPTKLWKIKSHLTGATRPIQWTVTSRGKVTADQLKEIIRRDFHEYDSMWIEQHGFEELESAIMRATTIKEVFDIFDNPPMVEIDPDE
jgi:hypothetical protein